MQIDERTETHLCLAPRGEGKDEEFMKIAIRDYVAPACMALRDQYLRASKQFQPPH